MSFFTIEQAPARLNRSELAVPGRQPQMFEKAAKSAADVVFLDLEDAVAPDDKAQARKNIIQAIGDIDWRNKSLSVRINGLDTHYMYRDVVDLLEQAGDRLDLIMIPKVGTASDVYAVGMLVTQVETAKGRKKRIGFEDAAEVSAKISDMLDAGEFDVCTLIYNRFKNVISQTPVGQQLIPAPLPETSVEGGAQYEFEPTEEEILARLLPQNLSIQLYRALLDNAAGFYGSQMTAMDNATRNAGEMINKLTLNYNRTRQANITRELIEIISGAEAL